jgi:hypothetical protein
MAFLIHHTPSQINPGMRSFVSSKASESYPHEGSTERKMAIIRPIIDLRAGHLTEMLEVASDQRGPLGQGNRRDQQVGSADLLEFLVLPQVVKLVRDCGVERDNGDPTEQFLAAPQPVLGLAELRVVGRLQDEVKPPAEDLDPRDVTVVTTSAGSKRSL